MMKARGRTSTKGSDRIAGLDARLCAIRLVSGVVHDLASLDDLAGESSRLPEWIALDIRDRALARAIALTTLRHRNGLHAALSANWKRPPPHKAWRLWHALETAAAQILFMDLPGSAAVNLAVSAIASHPPTARFSGFANAVLRSLAARSEAMQALALAKSPFPDWMQRRLTRDHGKVKTAAIAEAVRRIAPLDLSFRSQADREAFLAGLTGAAEAILLPGGTVRLSSRETQAVESLPGFHEGGWWVQDFAAAQPARLLGDVAGKRVADLCAAPGGKTLQLAAAGAHVTSVDQSGARLSRLGENLARTRLSAAVVEADLFDWEPDAPFDAILLDAPCTATGTMRRHPDILWNKREAQIAELATLQTRMIARAAKWLKPGGLFVYANCSIFKEEGEDLVAALGTSPGRLPGASPLPGPEASADGSPGKSAGSQDHPQDTPLQLSLLPIGSTAGRDDPPDGLPGDCINGQGCFRALPFHSPAAGIEPGMDGFFAARFIKGEDGNDTPDET